MSLVGCPFCRELFSRGEVQACPTCGVPLEPIEKLPPSYEERVAQAADLAATAPEDRRVAWWYYKRGRGALIVVAIAGLCAFFMPWIHLYKPDEFTFTGYHLARARGGWFFGGAVGWFVMIPLVFTRRTVYKMRGVRIVTATFAGMSAVEAAMLLLMPPRGTRYRVLDFEWGTGLYLTLALGLIGIALGARFGGRIEDINVRELAPEPSPDLSPDHDDSRTLH